MSRPTNCTREVVDKAYDYLSSDPDKNYKSYGHAIPSIVGLCRVLNRSRSSLYEWASITKDQEAMEEYETRSHFSDILALANECQELDVLNGGLSSDFNAHISALVLGKHGYHKKIDSDSTSSDGSMTPKDPISTIRIVPLSSDDGG